MTQQVVTNAEAINLSNNLFSNLPFFLKGIQQHSGVPDTMRATQWIINTSYNQRQRFFHLIPEQRML
jgi:hypothetical protein